MSRERQPIPKKALIFGNAALALMALAAACGGAGTKAHEPNNNTGGGLTPAPSPTETLKPTPQETTRPTPAPTPEATPRSVPPEEAKPIISVEFKPTTFEALKGLIDLAYENHPDAKNFTSQGRTYPREQIEHPLSICQSGDPVNRMITCAGLTRILYGFYVQSGYIEFWEAAVNTKNYVLYELPDRKQRFLEILEGQLVSNHLPTE